MTKKILQLFFILSIALVSEAQNDLSVKGILTNNLDYKIVYLENIISQKDLDSATIDQSGSFTIKTKIDKSDFYKLRFSQEHYVLLVLNPGESVDIEIDGSNFFLPKIKGSKNSELVYDTYDKLKGYDLEMQQLTKQIEQKKKDYIRTFILENLNSLSSLFFIENLSIEVDGEIYKKLDQSLTSLYPDNSMVSNLHERVKAISSLAIGSMAPEIDMPGLDGNNIKLSSLRGKYVLIDFWAAWCGPCRHESPNMVAMYKEFKKKGFEIYSVSLDNNKKDWEAAIKKDGLGSWTHVSDLKYWSNTAAVEYGVEAIPYTVLIDKEGKILDKGLRGEELKNKLTEIFKNTSEPVPTSVSTSYIKCMMKAFKEIEKKYPKKGCHFSWLNDKGKIQVAIDKDKSLIFFEGDSAQVIDLIKDWIEEKDLIALKQKVSLCK